MSWVPERYEADADDLEEVISTAAREAQGRVLKTVLARLEQDRARFSHIGAVQDLIARIDSGEDL